MIHKIFPIISFVILMLPCKVSKKLAYLEQLLLNLEFFPRKDSFGSGETLSPINNLKYFFFI